MYFDFIGTNNVPNSSQLSLSSEDKAKISVLDFRLFGGKDGKNSKGIEIVILCFLN